MQNRTWKRNLSKVEREVVITVMTEDDDNIYHENKHYTYFGKMSWDKLCKELDKEYDKYVIVSINYL